LPSIHFPAKITPAPFSAMSRGRVLDIPGAYFVLDDNEEIHREIADIKKERLG
jgi:hypothetical protein